MLFEELIPANPTTSSRAIQQHLFSLLQNCNTLKKLSQIHAQIVINGFTQKNYILVKLLSFYVASGNFKHALGVFKNIENPSATIWNQMVRGHGRSETPRKSIELYNRMVATEAEPDGFTYSFLLSACARAGLLREGEQVHGRVLANGYCSNLFVQTNLVNLYTAGGGANGVGYARSVFDEMDERTVVSWNSLLAGYIRCGDIDEARRIFDEMPERNVISWTTMISGCAHNGMCRQALSLFGEMRRAHVELDQVSLVAALSACAEIGNLNLGRWIHGYIEERMRVRNQPLLVSLNNALIHMYASCGVIDEAYKVFSKMPRKNTVSWTSIITGLAKLGRGEEALSVFRSMLGSGVNQVRPDEITFIGVLCACSHAGFVDEGRHLFERMNQTWGISPKIEHYGCMVDLLSRAGFLDEAYRLVETMPIRPNDAVWGALLGGCRIHKNVELASHVTQKLVVELDPGQAAGYLVLLSNVYATAKRWKDVVTVRQKMVEMGVKKPPGRSWVQINGTVHDFVASDRAHKHAPLIYEMLGEITRQAQQEGYEMDVIEAFLYVED
ncbi:pentatricopeptide repeat-containing protein At5g66520-like [Alnus glutinosa]|uniref:pentatricopeptide repeat-containing protein At5g66520-like n=1 Tax=Alnus glutinosa TaxID=3517 RepID=UPI002D7A0C53|nr:pentatricopeptide repeat-containing protein At5g66520-like [Alnus glutinosa]